MKFLTGFAALSMGLSASAQASTVVFDCQAEIRVDINESEKIGMTVEDQGTQFVAHLIGATDPGPFQATKEVKTLQDAMNVGGVGEILNSVILSPTDQMRVSSAVIYTQGQFDDDLAGVRGVEFTDSQGAVVAKGMYFGWAGPVSCR